MQPDSVRFIGDHTVLRSAPFVPEILLHQADDVMELWTAEAAFLGLNSAPLPFWAFPWVGGQAVARYVLDHPGTVANRHVLDMGTGSGVCAIAAAIAGAASVRAFDLDGMAVAAATMNAEVNGVGIVVEQCDAFTGAPEAGVALLGDVCYEAMLAQHVRAWLRQARSAGVHVLLGNPGRAHLPADLHTLAEYHIPASRDLEDSSLKPTRVCTLDSGEGPWNIS